MIRMIYIYLVLFLFSCKSEDKINNNSETGITQETENIDTAIQTKVDEDTIEYSEEIIEKEPVPTEQKEEKPELPPVFVEPKPIPSSSEGQIDDNKDTLSNEVGDEEKPELPPVFVDPKPIPTKEVKEESSNQSDFHASFNTILKKYVSSNGKVNYNGLKANRQALDQYTETLKANPPQASWSRNQKLAYWINAYNAFTLVKIIDNYPLKSITDLDNGKTWDVKWIKIGSNTYSLNNIENDIIRPRFNEPRIHFAVNCAAKSCPPLHNEAYTPGNLNRLLDINTKKFVNNSGFNSIENNSVVVSKIFDWYKEDFGNLIEFLNKYSNIKITDDATIKYKEYNWALNN